MKKYSNEDNSNKKDYKNLDIISEINKKIISLDKVRNSRINASKRLYNLSDLWEILFFFFNTIAVVSVIINSFTTQVSFFSLTGIYTIYVILIQYFIAKKNYNERALKLHYHQLEIENNILELKEQLIKWNENISCDKEEIILSYKNIMDKYSINLAGSENHEDVDFIDNKINKIIGKDQFFFWQNVMGLILFVVISVYMFYI